MESLLHEIAHYVALAIEAIAILIIATGSVRALIDVVRITLAPHSGHIEKRLVSLEYGHWLITGLTFQLAADVVNTSFAPTWNEVGRLAAVAAIRTFLSYFLDHEIDNTRRLQPVGAVPDTRAGSPLGGD